MNLKHFLTLLAGSATLFLVGCGPSMTNLTSQRVPQNASGIYTISMSVSNDNGSVIDETLSPKIVIDGEKKSMRRSGAGSRVFEFDYPMPEGRSGARYYFLLDYDVNYSGMASPRQISSSLYDLQLTNRYVITMESQRGPVGSEIPIVGRGFTNLDTVVIGGVEAETRFASAQAMSFIVPPLPAGEAYTVDLITGEGTIPMGYFQVDGSRLRAYPETLELASGERAVLIFGIEFPASSSGVYVNVKTDAPASIIMPDVFIPAGARTVSVPVQGGVAGKGILVAKAPGFNEVKIPLVVKGDVLPAAQRGEFSASSMATPSSQPPAPPAVGESDIVIVEDIEVIEE